MDSTPRPPEQDTDSLVDVGAARTSADAGRDYFVGQNVSHYVILASLGVGGMGEVYAALDQTLERKVALKAIRAERRLDAAARARFMREARILSQLDHPNVCRIYDYLQERDNDWLVLEVVDGKTLGELLDEGVDPSLKMKIAEQTAGVLVATHEAGVIHRDLKPANIMLTKADAVKVLDFGLARHGESSNTVEDDEPAAMASAESDHAPSDLPCDKSTLFETNAHGVMGTLLYMSPEQARGEPATAASDTDIEGGTAEEIKNWWGVTVATDQENVGPWTLDPELINKSRTG